MSEKKNLRLCGPERVQRWYLSMDQAERTFVFMQKMGKHLKPVENPTMKTVFDLMYINLKVRNKFRRDEVKFVYQILLECAATRERLRLHDSDFLFDRLQSFGIKILGLIAHTDFLKNVWKWIDHAMTLM